MKKFLLLCSAVVFAFSSVWAQERTVSGKVTSLEDGSPLPGVNVVIKGTTNGTVTDADGNYKLNLPSSGGALVFSFIGLQTQEVVVGDRTVVDVALSLDVQQLSEVVVTAQGIQREAKALGYATTTISSAALSDKPQTDVGRALQGKTPGVQILNSSGISGSGSRINIRGFSSISGDTQPLWVVDGVPINTQSNDISSSFVDGQVAPSRFLDIDPNNIESMSILRGLSATTTYGSQGRNGVILVTTKTGSKKQGGNKFSGSISQSYFQMEAIIPEFQNKWANGFDGAWGEFFSNWGPLFDGTPTGANHPYFEHRNLFPEFPEFAQSGSTNGGYVPVAAPNNVSDFFQKGYSRTTNVSLNGSNQNGSLGFSWSRLDEEGFVKYNNTIRDNFSLGGNYKFTDKLNMSATFNYSRTDNSTPPVGAGTGSNSVGGPSIWANLFYTPRNVDLTNWPWENPVTNGHVYYRNIVNPYWTLNNSRQTSLTDRFISSTSFNYAVNDWMNVTYRLGWDTYTEDGKFWVNKGGQAYAAEVIPGAYRSTSSRNTILDHSILANFKKELSSDLDITGVLGWNYRSNTFTQQGLESLGQVVYGLIEHRNFTGTLPRNFRGTNLNRVENSSIAGAFFEGNLGYKDMLYVTVSGRNDWSSILEEANRSKFYPGGSVAFLPTAAFPNFAANFLDFMKVRVAIGTSANFGSPYGTRPVLGLNSQRRVDAIGNAVTLSLPGLLANPDLRPELLIEQEVGIETKMFENRIRLDVSLYDRGATDQIIFRALDPSTGYTGTFINAGEVTNKGVEAAFFGYPIRKNDFSVELGVNFTKNVSKVESLPEGSKEIIINGFTTLANFAIEGQPLNVIKGTYIEKSPDGQRIVTANGDYKPANDIGIIADPNPKWLGSLIANVTWKGLNFGMQWDYVQGGQVYSYTAATMIGRGVAKDLESFDPTLPLILPGVSEVLDGSGNVTGYKPNTVPLTTSGVFFTNTIIGGGPDELGVYDATRVRFAEVSLGYSIPKSIVSKLKVNGINVSLQGNNLWFRAINAPKYAKADFDRTSFGTNNGAGIDFLGGPSARRYGATIKVSF